MNTSISRFLVLMLVLFPLINSCDCILDEPVFVNIHERDRESIVFCGDTVVFDHAFENVYISEVENGSKIFYTSEEGLLAFEENGNFSLVK